MKPQISSRVPAVLDGLITLIKADDPDPGQATALDDVQILDGPPVNTTAYEHDVVVVAPSDTGEPGVYVNRIPQASLGRATYLEEVEVTMLISCFGGDTTMKTRRDRATEIFNAVKRRVDANQVNAGAWDRLRLGPQEIWDQAQAETGAIVWIGFTIIATAVG